MKLANSIHMLELVLELTSAIFYPPEYICFKQIKVSSLLVIYRIQSWPIDLTRNFCPCLNFD